MSSVTLDAVANPDADGVVGSIVMYGGEVLPSTKWRWAHGDQELSRTEFSLLWSRFGERWGPGDGSTTFDLPDFDKKFPVGTDGTGADSAYETGDSGGSAAGAVAVTVSGSITGSVTTDSVASAGGAVAGFAVSGAQPVTGTFSGSGTGTADTVPPYNAVRFIVKVL